MLLESTFACILQDAYTYMFRAYPKGNAQGALPEIVSRKL